jgi:hypothetical protein
MDTIFNALLIHSCSISRRTLGSVNSYNIPSESFVVVSATEPCRIDPQKDRIEINVRGKVEVITLMGFFKPTADIQEWDVITWNSDTYEVIGIDLLSNDKELHHKEVYLKNLKAVN